MLVQTKSLCCLNICGLSQNEENRRYCLSALYSCKPRLLLKIQFHASKALYRKPRTSELYFGQAKEHMSITHGADKEKVVIG